MDATALPLVDELSTSVATALDILKKWQRTGLIAEAPGPTYGKELYRLLYMGRLLEATRDNIDKLSLVPGGYPVYLLRPDDVTTYQLDVVRPLQTMVQYQNFFAAPSQLSHDYALVAAVPGTAVVVTRHETQKSLLESSTGGFKCNGVPIYHGFPDPEVTAGQPCPKYPECMVPGGGQPVISPA